MGEETRPEPSIFRNDDVPLGAISRNSFLLSSVNDHNLIFTDLAVSVGHSAATETLYNGKLAGYYEDGEDDDTVQCRRDSKRACLDGLLRNVPTGFDSPEPHSLPNIQPENYQSRFLHEDILHEIFSHVLRVSDADFSVDLARSPFGRRTPSAVNILLVCRQWYRVGHVYVYECLVFRTAFQVQSFHNMLLWYNQGETDYQWTKMERLRRGVRRLRLEGVFGPLLTRTLKVLDATKIESLFMDVGRGFITRTRTISSCSGATALIATINPSHVVLDWDTSISFMSTRIVNTLIHRVPQWTRLKVLEVQTHDMHLPKLSDLIDSLLTCKERADTLQILFRLQNAHSLRELIPIFRKCEESVCKPATSLLIDTAIFEVAKAEKQLKGCLPTLPKTLKIFSACCMPGVFRPLFRPQKEVQVMQEQARRRLPLSVILRIADLFMESPGRIADERQYTTYLNQCRSLREIGHSEHFQNYCTNRCWKTLYIPNRYKLEYLSYKNVFPVYFDDSSVFIRKRLDQLVINPFFQEPEPWRYILLFKVDRLFEAMLRKVLILNIPLRHSMLPEMPNEMLHTLTLNIVQPCNSAKSFFSRDPSKSWDVGRLFACFPNVQHLFLTGCSLTEDYSLARPISYLWQSTVQDIHLDGTDESLFIISKCIFTSANAFHLDYTEELRTRTRPINLTTIFYHTPNIRTLYISIKSCGICFFETLEPNHSIRKIVIVGPLSNGGFSNLIDILLRIDVALFEALEEMQFAFFDRPWTWEKRETNTYIKWSNLAGQTVKKYGVKFTNKDGVVWVPRMYCAPQCLPQLQHVPRPRKRKRGACS